jgi:hypothetical protein
MNLFESLQDRLKGRVQEAGILNVGSLWEVVAEVLADGNLDASDYAPLVSAAEQAFDHFAVIIDLPYIPEFIERSIIDPFLRAQIPGAVKALFRARGITV